MASLCTPLNSSLSNLNTVLSNLNTLEKFHVAHRGGFDVFTCSFSAPTETRHTIVAQTLQASDWLCFILAMHQLRRPLALKELSFNSSFLEVKKAVLILKNSSLLETLEVRGRYAVNDETFFATIGKFNRNLRTLDLSGIQEIQPSWISHLQTCSKLSSLNLSHQPLLDDASFEGLLEKIGGSLRKLILHNCPQLTSKLLWILQRYCPHLTHLDVGGCLKITSETGLVDFLSAISLKGLVLDGIELRSILSYFPDCQELEVLSICDTSITDQELALLGQRVPHLRKANFSYCCSLTSEGFLHLIKQCVDLEQVIALERVELSFLEELYDVEIVS